METYQVQPGDTLYGIAKRYNMTVDELRSLNNLTSNNINVGQIINLGIPLESNYTYTVKAGDSLYKIAQTYNTTVNDIISLNNLTTTLLKIGQVLRIPENYIDEDEYILYTVKSGDSLYKIAQTYNTTVDKIKKDNNLSSNLLNIGQVLKIYTDELVPIHETYTVKSGDTLYSIAKKYNVKVSSIIDLNDLKNTSLSVGQTLKIPFDNIEIKECFGEEYEVEEEQYILYTVKKGDNLYAIARTYNTSVANIMSLNNLPNANLSIGQTLKIKEG